MAKIDKAQRSALKRLMTSPGWDVLEQALANRLATLRKEPIVGGTAHEELRMLHKQQGKIEGLVEFFDDVEKQVLDD